MFKALFQNIGGKWLHAVKSKLVLVLLLSILVHIGDREDNHCQEEGWAKSVWRETRIFGGD